MLTLKFIFDATDTLYHDGDRPESFITVLSLLAKVLQSLLDEQSANYPQKFSLITVVAVTALTTL